ncbi:MAG: glycosyltransferase family 1 protein [Betaproteobacteria bacterium]
MSDTPTRVLLELRPALDGHAGIPQETRLLYRSLARIRNARLEGMLLSSTRMLPRGIPADSGGMSVDRQINRLSRVIVALQSGEGASAFERAIARFKLALSPLRAIASTMLGLRQSLTVFDPRLFKDFVWRAMFEKTLPSSDFDLVMGTRFRVARLPWTALHAAGLITRRIGLGLYPTLDTRDFDVMIAETPYPGRVRRPTRLVVRYHDAIPLLMPHTISDKSYHQASHFHALRRNVADGAWFACVSESTRRDLLSVFPQAEARSVTIPNMVSHHYHDEKAPFDRIPEILRVRRHSGLETAESPSASAGGVVPYLLLVSTIEPRKNHLSLLSAWEHLRSSGHPNLQLVFVGSLGWSHHAIVKRFKPWLARGGLHVLEFVPSDELRLLYRHATVTVCPSFGEGFDYSGVEAMRCGGVVAASDIPVHREIFDDAAVYFSPYSVTQLTQCIGQIIEPGADERRSALVDAGARVSERYTFDSVQPLWDDFLARVMRES